jgi:nucleotide-binding universal stress UspA family protein
MTHIRHILVATDFGASSERAVQMAVDLANQFGARLTLFHAYELPSLGLDGAVPCPVDLVTPIKNEAEKTLAAKLEEVRRESSNADSVLCAGSPSDGILEVSEQRGADLIIVGTHGRRGLERALLGSVAERTVRLSKIPVLSVSGDCTACKTASAA